MMKILLTNGEVKAGAIKLPGRKLPSICIQKDDKLILLGHFYSMAIDALLEKVEEHHDSD